MILFITTAVKISNPTMNVFVLKNLSVEGVKDPDIPFHSPKLSYIVIFKKGIRYVQKGRWY
jgi:hypothetical protein